MEWTFDMNRKRNKMRTFLFKKSLNSRYHFVFFLPCYSKVFHSLFVRNENIHLLSSRLFCFSFLVLTDWETFIQKKLFCDFFVSVQKISYSIPSKKEKAVVYIYLCFIHFAWSSIYILAWKRTEEKWEFALLTYSMFTSVK